MDSPLETLRNLVGVVLLSTAALYIVWLINADIPFAWWVVAPFVVLGGGGAGLLWAPIRDFFDGWLMHQAASLPDSTSEENAIESEDRSDADID